METNNPSPWVEFLMSFVFFAAGVAIILLSADVIPMEDSQFNVPRWLVGIFGGLFASAGIMIFTKGRWEWINNILIFFFISGFGCIFMWVAIFGDAEGFSVNGQSDLNMLGVFFARTLFGLFGGVCLLLVFGSVINAIYERIKKQP